MGFEGPRGNLSLNEIIAGLDSGEIVRGDNKFDTITMSDTSISFNRTTGELYFTENGVTTHALITPEGAVTGIQLTESVTGNPYRDRELARVKQQFLESIAPQLLAK